MIYHKSKRLFLLAYSTYMIILSQSDLCIYFIGLIQDAMKRYQAFYSDGVTRVYLFKLLLFP